MSTFYIGTRKTNAGGFQTVCRLVVIVGRLLVLGAGSAALQVLVGVGISQRLRLEGGVLGLEVLLVLQDRPLPRSSKKRIEKAALLRRKRELNFREDLS